MNRRDEDSVRHSMFDFPRLLMSKSGRKKPRYLREEEVLAKPEKGRLSADLSQQASNNSYDPPLYYEDIEFRCISCRSYEVWTAKQQKWWYEVAKGSIYSTAIRCRACRQTLRECQSVT